ncbi:uncharacterized protein LOC135475784 [Liolophura sinensis]|uniref:uncharacterized protein LOC135475784 n=1 Tax=Liolophura sinensis TaxID=3198878 RepID=UPI003158228B
MAILSVRRRKQLTYFVIGMVFLLGGIEYAVILPTMWLYIESRFHAQEYFLGLMLAAFCFSGLFSGPLMGRWSDVTRRTKIILLFANCWEIGGNIMYFLGISKWFLFGSRLVSGVGAGAEATLVAELARVTSAQKRTGVLSMFIAIRQFGLLIGPGFNLFLRELHFYIGPFLVDKYTSPGAFMALLWTLLQLLILCGYSELSALAAAENDTLSSSSVIVNVSTNQSPGQSTQVIDRLKPPQSSANQNGTVSGVCRSAPTQDHTGLHKPLDGSHSTSSCPQNIAFKPAWLEYEDWQNSSELIESAERYMYVSSENDSRPFSVENARPHSCQEERTSEIARSYGSVNSCERQTEGGNAEDTPIIRSGTREEAKSHGRVSYPWRYYYNEYMREPVVVLLGIQFISFFNQVALETMITPLTKTYLNWGELENSIMYCGAGAQIIAVFFLVRWLSSRLQDRTMILIGCTVLTIANAWLIWVIPNAVPGEMKQNLPKFIVGLILDIFSLPFLIVCSVSLYSKVTHKETQGFSQGLRRSVSGVATIMGPLWAGSALPWPYIMLGVMLGLITVALIMLLLSFRSLNLSEDFREETPRESLPHNERTPLLA